jgi:hypothetical protein
MFDDSSNLKDNGGQKNMLGNGFNKVPVFTLLAWAGLIAAVAVLFLVKEHITAPAAPITYAEFLEKIQSNQIANATVIVNQQSLPLVQITGSYFKLGKEGKPMTTEIPFVVHNALPTQNELTQLARAPNVSEKSQPIVLSLLWGIAPLLILGGAPFCLLAIGVLIFLFSSKGPLKRC